jgi:hypothetical protein
LVGVLDVFDGVLNEAVEGGQKLKLSDETTALLLEIPSSEAF